MKLNKIVLKNIFSYYEEEVIDFDNLTLIIAKNGLGKTSILNAIKLCLGYSKIEIDSIFNNNSKYNISSIAIHFDDFLIEKTWILDTRSEDLKITFNDGDFITDLEANEFIKERFPNFIVDLIFYDGEIDSNILLLSQIKFKNLFEFIFDLDLLQNMYKDSLKASKELILEDGIKENSIEYNLIKNKIDNNTFEVEKLKDKKESIEITIKIDEKEVVNLDRQIRKENKKLDKYKQKLENYNIVLDEKIILFRKGIIFEMPLLLNKKLRVAIFQKNKPVIEIKNQNEFNKRFEKFSQFLNIDNLNIKKTFNDMFLNNSCDIELSFSENSFKKLLIEIKDLQNNIDGLKISIEKIEKNELLNQQFQIIYQKYTNKNRQLEKLKDNLNEINNEISELVENSKILEKDLTKLYKNQKNSFAILKSYEELIKIANISKEIYQKELNLKLINFNKLLDIATRKFRDIYSHIKTIQISSNLKFEVLDYNNKQLAKTLLSAGQKQVLNFLIIKTILEFRKFSDFLIVDTPFGRLSEDNRELILNDCYMKFDQLTLLLTDSEFQFIDDKNIEAIKYKIDKTKLGSRIEKIK